MKQERSVDEGPLHGSDFLSVFIDSSLPKKTFRTFTESSRKAFDMSTERRFPRSTLQVSSYTDATRRKSPTVGNFKINRNSKATSDNKNNDELVVAVRVSASVGRTLINKNEHRTSQEQGKNDIEENITQWTPTEKSKLIKAAPEYVPSNGETQTNPNHITDVVDQISIASEEHPSIIAESNKNEFNIEEKEPITTNSDMMNPHNSYVDNFQLSQRLPDFNPPPDLLERGQSQTKVHPYQQTVIFHNTGTDQARSVSYSTVAQGVSNLENKNWDGEN
ncbi:hypothetical protein HHI36_012582 [Cryptolaemus montrouzieri]|uniref:Uncharacterized protein n=1 Tax=Cryptolaemus montrouzieri TaxID=559131 RepID=A0ABD2NFQ3_9CUCU